MAITERGGSVVDEDRRIVEVEIVDADGTRSVVWEFSCEACDDFSTGLYRVEAESELREHSCRVEALGFEDRS